MCCSAAPAADGRTCPCCTPESNTPCAAFASPPVSARDMTCAVPADLDSCLDKPIKPEGHRPEDVKAVCKYVTFVLEVGFGAVLACMVCSSVDRLTSLRSSTDWRCELRVCTLAVAPVPACLRALCDKLCSRFGVRQRCCPVWSSAPCQRFRKYSGVRVSTVLSSRRASASKPPGTCSQCVRWVQRTQQGQARRNCMRTRM